MKVLILAGHLDDSVLAVGGIIRKIVDAGGQVDVVCFGNSDEDFSTPAERPLVVERALAQAQEAHRLLGVQQFTCFNYSDYAVQENKETYRLCIESIRRSQPDIILAHYWAEYFQHRAMARLTCDAWWQAAWSCSADLGAPWLARALYHFEVMHLLPEPSEIVDISDTFEAKMAAWQCFQSSTTAVETPEGTAPRQYGAIAGSLSDQLECRARYYGSLIGVRYAEALQQSHYLPRAVHQVTAL